MNHHCNATGTTCLSTLAPEILDCEASCSGLIADVSFIRNDSPSINDMEMEFARLSKEYTRYKNSFATLRKFDPRNETLGKQNVHI